MTIKITTDIVDITIHLLLSKDAMKKAETKIDFENTTVTMFGETQDVLLTKCGHYAIPLNKNRKISKQIKSEGAFKIKLMTVETMEKKNMA